MTEQPNAPAYEQHPSTSRRRLVCGPTNEMENAMNTDRSMTTEEAEGELLFEIAEALGITSTAQDMRREVRKFIASTRRAFAVV